jgi:hypothetical protein
LLSRSDVDKKPMSFFEKLLVGRQIHSVHVDSEVTYIMLSDGTHVTIPGLVLVEPGRASGILESPATAVRRDIGADLRSSSSLRLPNAQPLG